ncbi:MAG: acyl-CoA thioesterase [Candidatus Gastranaerophilales bacterium]|nr:acyl-CoA thioesterase [Candidatus Gastranaerophilales bacterium]
MEHAFKQKVFYSDTDAYGVVWHGSYLRWLEMGRVMLCEEAGYKLSELVKENIILPVVNLNIAYKNSAKLDDIVTIKTNIVETGRFYITFNQKILDEKEEKEYIDATVKVVAINEDGKLYRSLPEPILDIINHK